MAGPFTKLRLTDGRILVVLASIEEVVAHLNGRPRDVSVTWETIWNGDRAGGGFLTKTVDASPAQIDEAEQTDGPTVDAEGRLAPSPHWAR